MKIYIPSAAPMPEQIKEMLEALQAYIKLAVDIERGVIAGGGEMHAELLPVAVKCTRIASKC